MFGIPDQPMRGWRTCQVKMRMLGVGHASIYPYDRGDRTTWARLNRYKEQSFEPRDLLFERMYRENHEQLEALGMKQYHLHNFYSTQGLKHLPIQPELRSTNNLMHWESDREYLAFGMGASNLIDGKRIKRPSTLAGYRNYV